MNADQEEMARPPSNASSKQFVMDAFERYERRLTAYAAKFYQGTGGDLDAARDAVQFTFLKLCQQSPAELDGKLAPWLYTVCRNRILDDLAKTKKRPTSADPNSYQTSAEPDPAESCQQNDFLKRLPRLLNELSDSEREVVELWSEGLKPKEIAEVLGRSSGTIRVQLHRAIKSLQEHPLVRPWLERATSQSESRVDAVPSTQAIQAGK